MKKSQVIHSSLQHLRGARQSLELFSKHTQMWSQHWFSRISLPDRGIDASGEEHSVSAVRREKSLGLIARRTKPRVGGQGRRLEGTTQEELGVQQADCSRQKEECGQRAEGQETACWTQDRVAVMGDRTEGDGATLFHSEVTLLDRCHAGDCFGLSLWSAKQR